MTVKVIKKVNKCKELRGFVPFTPSAIPAVRSVSRQIRYFLTNSIRFHYIETDFYLFCPS